MSNKKRNIEIDIRVYDSDAEALIVRGSALTFESAEEELGKLERFVIREEEEERLLVEEKEQERLEVEEEKKHDNR